jgi:hypothetical protein
MTVGTMRVGTLHLIPEKGKKSGFFLNRKIFDCEPTSATGELKKEVNVRI